MQNKDKEKEKRQKEIEYIYELLQETMKEEGYEIPKNMYADRGYKAFEIPLRNKVIKEEKMMIKISYNNYE